MNQGTMIPWSQRHNAMNFMGSGGPFVPLAVIIPTYDKVISMSKCNLTALLLLLFVGGAGAAVYKWMDGSGRVHYGDQPPAGSHAQSIALPESPSQEEVEQARQQMREKIEQYEKASEEATPLELVDMPSEGVEARASSFDIPACFSTLSEVVQGPSAELFTPITPTTLTKAQSASLKNLFSKTDAHWKGTIFHMRCIGSSSKSTKKSASSEARTTVNWDARNSQLAIETDSVGKESGVNERLVQRFEVSDVLYFTDIKQANIVAMDGSMVEVLALYPNGVSFFIKQHIPTALGARKPRGEVRHLEISGRTLKLTELFYYNEMFTDSKSWILSR